MTTIIFWSIIILLVLPKGISLLSLKAINNKIVKKSTAGRLFLALLKKISGTDNPKESFKAVCKKIADAYDD